MNLRKFCLSKIQNSNLFSFLLRLENTINLMFSAISETSKGSDQDDMMFQMEELSDSSSSSTQGYSRGNILLQRDNKTWLLKRLID